MSKFVLKTTAIALLLGTTVLPGCVTAILQDAALSAAYELIWDNDALLDLFGDDAPGTLL